ncbi:MAG TPA: hypothetical protein VM345_14485 [Acidimicrobiales bacterium]|nr:hypothetical protein [Acidimicrobiales bacterium]
MTTRRWMHAGLDLLDRHVVDRDGRAVGKVDDLEIECAEDGTVEVTALLLGPEALGRRIGGALGRSMGGIAARFSGDPEPARIGLELVEELDIVIKLKHPLHQLPVGRFERWVREHVIEPLPGATDATG